MQATQIILPERLKNEFDHTKGLVEQLKQKNSQWEKDAKDIVALIEKIPSYYLEEERMVTEMIVRQKERISGLEGEEKEVAQAVLERIEIVMAGDTERFWIHKLISLQTKLNPMLQ